MTAHLFLFFFASFIVFLHQSLGIEYLSSLTWSFGTFRGAVDGPLRSTFGAAGRLRTLSVGEYDRGAPWYIFCREVFCLSVYLSVAACRWSSAPSSAPALSRCLLCVVGEVPCGVVLQARASSPHHRRVYRFHLSLLIYCLHCL